RISLSRISKGENHRLALVACRGNEGTFSVGFSRGGTRTKLVGHQSQTGSIRNPCSFESRANLWAERRADLRADCRLKSRWFSRDQALCVTTNSLAEWIYAI